MTKKKQIIVYLLLDDDLECNNFNIKIKNKNL